MPIINQKSIFNFKREIEDALLGFESHQAGRYNREISARNYRSVEKFNVGLRSNPKIRTPWKSYPTAYQILLPRDQDAEMRVRNASFGEILSGRRSVRRYSGDSVGLGVVSELLFSAWGDGKKDSQFAAPSGGARLPIEIYLFIFRVSGAPPGIYHFNRRSHSLELVEEVSSSEALKELRSELGLDDPTIDFEKANFVILLTAVLQRTLKKYGNRGWRLILLDAGHLGQNLWLTGSALKLGVCGFGAGYDSRVANRLRLNPASESPVIAYVFGTPTEASGCK